MNASLWHFIYGLGLINDIPIEIYDDVKPANHPKPKVEFKNETTLYKTNWL